MVTCYFDFAYLLTSVSLFIILFVGYQRRFFSFPGVAFTTYRWLLIVRNLDNAVCLFYDFIDNLRVISTTKIFWHGLDKSGPRT